MNGKTIQRKLVGSDDERAVSPVIGVILMVAITVILAAVIAAFVLDLGGSVSEEAQAGVNLEVDEQQEEVNVEITSLGNADYVKLAGDVNDGASDTNNITNASNEFVVGDTVTLIEGTAAPSSDDELSSTSGTVTAVAVIEEDGTETQVASEEYDFS